MVELVKYIATELVMNKEEVSVTLEGDAIKLTVAKSDMGRVIGKQGRVAKSIRTVVRAAATMKGEKYSVDIVDPEGAKAQIEGDEK